MPYKSPEAQKAYAAAHYRKNKAKYAAARRKWRALNPKKAAKQSSESSRRWKKKYPGRRSAQRKRLHRATPAWADLKKIGAMYTRARLHGLTVDHEYPIKGRTVCGLHVHQNLRLMSLTANMRKGNRLPDHLKGSDYDESE